MRAFLALLFCVALSPRPPRPTPIRRGRSGCSFRSRRPASPICPGASSPRALRAKLGQPVIVENKPGANGVIGLRELLKADADGYTLMVGNVGSLVINYAIDAKAPFDPMKDVVPIAGTAEYADRHGGQQQDCR